MGLKNDVFKENYGTGHKTRSMMWTRQSGLLRGPSVQKTQVRQGHRAEELDDDGGGQDGRAVRPGLRQRSADGAHPRAARLAFVEDLQNVLLLGKTGVAQDAVHHRGSLVEQRPLTYSS